MSPGTPDLILLILVFVGLQAWWIIPIIKKNNKLNNRGRKLREEINKLEKLYKSNKYSHKRIWQVGMILKVRLEAMKKNKKKLYSKAKFVEERFDLANQY